MFNSRDDNHIKIKKKKIKIKMTEHSNSSFADKCPDFKLLTHMRRKIPNKSWVIYIYLK